jgi:hypothetical protein
MPDIPNSVFVIGAVITAFAIWGLADIINRVIAKFKTRAPKE